MIRFPMLLIFCFFLTHCGSKSGNGLFTSDSRLSAANPYNDLKAFWTTVKDSMFAETRTMTVRLETEIPENLPASHIFTYNLKGDSNYDIWVLKILEIKPLPGYEDCLGERFYPTRGTAVDHSEKSSFGFIDNRIWINTRKCRADVTFKYGFFYIGPPLRPDCIPYPGSGVGDPSSSSWGSTFLSTKPVCD